MHQDHKPVPVFTGPSFRSLAGILLIASVLLALAFTMTAHAENAGGRNQFSARFAGQQTVDGSNAIAVTFSGPLETTQDLTPFFKIVTAEDSGAVEGAWMLAKDPSVAYFTQITPGTKYRISVEAGLRSGAGKSLPASTIYEITTRQAEPMIAFSSRGFLLASGLIRGLPVDSLNIPRADIDFFRIKPGKTAQFKNLFADTRALYNYQSRDLNKLSDLVYTGRWDLDIQKDLRTQVNLPITDIPELQTPGIYFAVLRGAGHYTYGYSSTWFTISELGIHARKYPQSVDFYIQNLKSATPVRNAKVEGFDKKGTKLFSIATSPSGKAVALGRLEKLSLVVVTKGKSLSLLPMDAPTLDLTEFHTGTMPFRPVDLFVYSPRDIYRPGETVYLDGILRNQDGGIAPALPIQVKVLQPDGRMIREFTWNPGPQNHFFSTLSLPENAMTGQWRVTFSNGADRLSDFVFLVSEFMPEQMKLDVGAKETPEILKLKDKLRIKTQGDYLYGAPAGGSRVNAQVHISPARELFKGKWPGYQFGDIRALINTSYTTEDIRLDKSGRGNLLVENRWTEAKSPHKITANVSLYGSGGRPVVRNRYWQVWPADTLVGIRNVTGTDDAPGFVPEDSVAEFSMIAVDETGTRTSAKNLEATFIREHREYYWEYTNGEWKWGHTSQFYPVDHFKVDLTADEAAKIAFPVAYGGYRLEIFNPATKLTSAIEIRAGWQAASGQQSAVNRPDRVDILLDKPAYQAGDIARVTLNAPEAGQGFLFVDADQNLLTLPITVPEGGRTIDLPMNPEWQRHDLYVSALVIRPGEAGTARLPKRAIGLAPLPLDRQQRHLDVMVQAPEKTEPGRTVKIPVAVQSAAGTPVKDAWVTLAAVDVGILNLTGFKTPSPFDYFFQDRACGVAMLDVYQKLIEAGSGEFAKQRFGGDAPVLSRGGSRPATDVQIVSIHHPAVRTDSRGKAVFDLDLPEFDGQVRFMAVAHTETEYGSGQKETILASPLVVQATMPRFMAAGDTANLSVDFDNRSDVPQKLEIEMALTGPVTMTGQTSGKLELNPKEKRSLRFPLAAQNAVGRSDITCRITGLQGTEHQNGITRRWFLETRSAWPPLTRIFRSKIEPGKTFQLDEAFLSSLDRDNIRILAALASEPPVNVAAHFSQLTAYPYGCLEQTVSGLFVHTLLSSADLAALGIAAGTSEETAKRIELGIQRLLEKQKSSGGFGLWSSTSMENAWLTAYAAHFFVNAAQAGYPVPKTAVQKALKRLLLYVRRPNVIPGPRYVDQASFRAAVQSYAAFVLARVQSVTLSDARAVSESAKKHAKTPLALIQAGIALGLSGDRPGAVRRFDQAYLTKRKRHLANGDYGSNLRDAAFGYALLASYFPEYKAKTGFLEHVNTVLQDREWLSTQEQNALVMAGAASMKTEGRPWQAEILAGAERQTLSLRRFKQVLFDKPAETGNFAVSNTGTEPLYVNVAAAGYPVNRPAPSSNGVQIQRRFLDTNGYPKDATILSVGDRVIIELSVTAEERMPHALAVDLIPAGLELEDPGLSGSFPIDEIVVDKKQISAWRSAVRTNHTEYRDDRFAAAADIYPRQTARFFYSARAVHPGIFEVPPPLAEDMYRPYIRGVGDAILQMKIIEP